MDVPWEAILWSAGLGALIGAVLEQRWQPIGKVLGWIKR